MSNVGYATLQIIPSAKGFGTALNRATEPSMAASGKRGGEQAGKGFSSAFLPGVKSLAAGFAGMWAGSKAVSFLKDSVSAASDLNEAGTALKQVFGEATGNVLNFAQAGAKGLGQSNLAIQNAATTFGVYGKAAGLAGKANADFSTQMVQLSTDLASFYNTSPDEAMQALAAGLRGESEPLRRYGVLLNDAQLRQEAMALGITKTTKDALTPQQRVLAAHALIMKQTSVAQGDFQRTSGGLANSQRILSAEVENLKAKVGAALLPVITATTHFIANEMVPALSATFGFLSDNKEVLTPLVEILGGFAAALLVVKGAVLAWDLIQKVLNFDLKANPIGLVIAALAALAVGIIYAYKHSETFRNVVNDAFHVVAVAVDFVKDHWKAFVTVFAGLIGGPLLAGVVLIVTHFGQIKKTASDLYHSVSGFFGGIASVVRGVPGKIADAARGMWDGIKNSFRSMMNWLIGGWNRLQFSLPSVDTHIPGVGTIGGWSIGTPDIPYLAKGGVTTGATLAMIGEAGPEAVIPLDRLDAILASRGGATWEGANDSARKSQPETIHHLPLVLDGRQIAEAVFTIGGQDLYHGRKEF